MAEPRHHQDPRERARLALYAHEIHEARERLQAARGLGARASDVRPLRVELLTALETYAAAITEAGAPVPRQLLAEIELYRQLQNRP